MADGLPEHDDNVALIRNLAVVTQLHLPGTAGRLGQQIRDLEAAAPAFAKAGLVRRVERPVPLNLRASGIASYAPTPARALGGFLYASGAVRVDVIVNDNRVATGTQNSVCEVDDIDFEHQRERLRLIGIRQVYELADAAMRDGERRDVIVLDCPLLLSRSMVAPRDDLAFEAHRESYVQALDAIERFWQEHRGALFPWSRDGTIVASIGTGRYAAVLDLATQDLRTRDGRGLILPSEPVDQAVLGSVEAMEKAIGAIGQQRFLNGVLGAYTRTVAHRMNVQSPRMEPSKLASEGVVGFHFKAASGSATRFAHVLGEATAWSTTDLDQLAGWLMAMSAVGGRQAEPLPILLAERELRPLEGFLKHYAFRVRDHLRARKIEEGWLEGIDELD